MSTDKSPFPLIGDQIKTSEQATAVSCRGRWGKVIQVFERGESVNEWELRVQFLHSQWDYLIPMTEVVEIRR